MSLRARVLVGFVLIAVVLAVATLVTARRTQAALVRQVDDELLAVARPGRDLGFERRPGPGATPAQRLSEFYVAHVAPDGSVEVLVEPNVSDDDLAVTELALDEVASRAATLEPFTTGGGPGWRAVARPIGPAGGVLVVAQPLSAVDDALRRVVTVQVVATVGVLGVLAAVAWWVLHLGIRPIKAMTATATAIAGGDLAARVPDAPAGTEAGDLGRALNRMLDERTQGERRLRRFVADASHELRTPVTTIRGYAELYRAGGLADPDELAEAMRRTEQEAVRMGNLVEDMLQLARLDQGRPLERAPVDLAALAADAARDATAVDPERPVRTDLAGPVVVLGDEDRLRQVLANVVGNALVHTEPGTALDLRAGVDGGTGWVEVADHGPGMPPEVAERVFERFYRADPSRSRHRGGTGLGLAIVDATVAAHGGTVRLASEPGAGTTVRIELPTANPPPALS